MAEFSYTLEAVPTLGGVDVSIAENRIVERDDLALVSVAIPAAGEEPLAQTMQAAWGLPLPGPTLSTTHGQMRAIKTAPDQLLLVFPHAMPDAEAIVQGSLGGTGYTTDQTDAWIVLDVSGPDTSAAMERLCMLDLTPPAFPENAAARTVMEHMASIVVRIGDEGFQLMAARSSAASFLHAVETSCRNVCG